ncbi:hypothetical protein PAPPERLAPAPP_01170 [Brevundimonas phage vB_BpoS-Papperlapapp]|uniref:Uncharacterized protein n=1 Tax=Brevundimonas phage vB_BpoS-Domovoi TaxID=2948598 RepID=A0A9E7SK86_9CAUD|nr:hypothetical protein DOMOVOI_00110 [Brevundimonas phage vB_BpoS-Domovoi]USN15859.1 hypothetical protein PAPPERLAPAPP_01170 [Brevundimonas phage vB_BpoS-Papperlapapp]
MARRLIGTVQVREGAAVCVKPDGATLYVGDAPATFQVAFGGLRPYDAGKRIYRIDGHFYMENDDQRAARLGGVH